MSASAIPRLLVSVLFVASACSSTDTKTTARSGLLTAPTPNPAAPTPAAPNSPGPVMPLPFPAPNPPGPLPPAAPLPPNPPAPNPPGPVPPFRTTPSFVIIGTPTQQSVSRGGRATFLFSVRSINGFRGEVTMFARILPDNEWWAGASWSPQPVMLAAGGTATTTLTIDTNSTTPAGAQAITVEGWAGDIQDTATLLLTVR